MPSVTVPVVTLVTLVALTLVTFVPLVAFLVGAAAGGAEGEFAVGFFCADDSCT